MLCLVTTSSLSGVLLTVPRIRSTPLLARVSLFSGGAACSAVVSAFFYRESHEAAPLSPGSIVNTDILQIQQVQHGEPGNGGPVA